ncbi:hypothetical protein MNBD_NITROSPINAE02-1607 [hydrothermal vent metagenome]|uniref:histidine kinase n=1 Tax=hydrothermal vent metagenome TaxID=652676 RepID=A0A3B1CH07_9ZZZZ
MMAEDQALPEKSKYIAEDLMMMIVHDLKGPAGEIIANLEMLGGYITDEFGAEILLTAVNSTEELLEMIVSILDVGKMESGEMNLVWAPVDLVELMKEKVAKVEGMAMRENKNILFESRLDKYETKGDRDILSRVFWNILSNANNHTSLGGTIRITMDKAGDGVDISISDDGSGIAADHLEHVFDKFYQPEGVASKKYSSGLGLSFCQMAVKAHGGEIRAESAPGKGATFCIHLP